jgi:hypothetical protein
MLLDLALLVRDLGFLLYGGPMVAFAVLVVLRDRLPGAASHEVIRTYRSWGPGLGLSLGACVFGALAAHWLTYGAFDWTLDRPLEAAAWLMFLLMWMSNIQLEVWTLEPLRKLDRDRGLADPAQYADKSPRLARHMGVQAALVLFVAVLGRLAG